MSAPIRHTMLVANAGSGKTYALTTRMVKLLALGVEPRKIAALTFTKKAAGEFLDAVFLRLAQSALDEKKLEKLNEDLNAEKGEGSVPPLDAARCRELLAKLVSDSGRLTMGTIDGLFARIARSFPLESGLPGEFSMIGESELERARTEALAAIFRESEGGGEFLDLVRRIARRKGEREVFRTLLQSVKDFHEKFLQKPELPWGDRDLIWPSGKCEILAAGDVKPAAEAFLKEIERSHPGLGDKAAAKIAELVGQAIEHKTGSAWSKSLKGFIAEKLSGEFKTNDEGIPFFGLINGSPNNRILLRPNLDALRVNLRNALLKPLYESLLGKSAALHRFMEEFEGSYHELTRRRGRMTFSDVTDLLSSQVENLDWITSAGYRLDAKLDHWLLDEFQDTSRIQWKVLGSFIDEVIQDSGGERSLFYVGDTKQAIYSWRGGDPKLFFEIFKHYNDLGSRDHVFARDLSVSYRSAATIIEVVNRVFGTIGDHASNLGIPEKTVESWKEAWREHLPAPMNEKLKGYMRWDAVESDENDENLIHQRIVRILQEVESWRRNLSCGVLTRKNEDAAAIASLLQSNGIPVALEGKSNPCNDNPLGIALLAAFRAAAFPQDTLSLELLRCSPLGSLLKEGDGDGDAEGVESFRASALEVIAAQGYEAAVREWTKGLSLNPFLSRRAADFLSAAAEYDGSGRGSVFEFISFLESHVVQEAEASGVVRVMTVHQCKGLTFDMSLVTGLDGKGGNNTDILHLGGGDPPTWGCLLPSKDLAESDPVLSEALDERRAEEEYGRLCTAYVAMTRSKQALYVLTKKLKEDTSAKNFARLLMLTIHSASDVLEIGDENWFAGHQIGNVEKGVSRSGEESILPCTAGTPHSQSPSSLAVKLLSSDQSGARAAFSSDAADLGTEIHEVLSRIAWDSKVVDLSGCSDQARKLLAPFLQSKVAEKIFTMPEGDWDLWNERAFDLMIDNVWISGIFDRVHICRKDGRAVEARIYDYKTNRSTPEAIAKEYEGQMDQYRKAIAALLGIGVDQVSAQTVPIRVS
jgi:ATP-dependent exoDNAse (exonuclease V) beta subunit